MSQPMNVTYSPEFLAESRSSSVLISEIVLFALAAIVVCLRFWTRLGIMRTWRLDDTFVLLSILVAAANLGLVCAAVKYGLGRHQASLTLDDYVKSVQVSLGTKSAYVTALALTKISICISYLEIWKDKTSRYLVYGIIAFLVLTYIPVMVAQQLNCIPYSLNWALTPEAAACAPPVGKRPLVYVQGSLNIVGDLLCLFFVLPRVIKLKIDRHQKWLLFGLMSLSLLVITAALIRMILIGLNNGDDADTPWDTVTIAIWSSIEVNVGIICVAAPVLRPLIRSVFPRFASSGHDPTHPSTARSGVIRLNDLPNAAGGPGHGASRFRDGIKVQTTVEQDYSETVSEGASLGSQRSGVYDGRRPGPLSAAHEKKSPGSDEFRLLDGPHGFKSEA